jgi:ATP-binding cassette subfamily B protein
MTRYQGRPIAFLARYARLHAAAHAVIIGFVVLAVVFATSSQYALKGLIDVVAQGPQAAGDAIWRPLIILCGLIAGDNFSWRVSGWVAARTFTRVTGDVRSDLFLHLAGHAPSYFSDRLPGTMAGRISATANAIYLTENTLTWNVLPPCLAVVIAILFLGTINPVMAGALAAVSLAMALVIYGLAKRGTKVHRAYAEAASRVDGELVDVIGNMHVVRAFGATLREHRRLRDELGEEMGARTTSLLYLEKLRLLHAAMTAVITAGLLFWGVMMWRAGTGTAGDLVLITSMGFTILHGTRDLAVALVDLTQNVARLEEAVTAVCAPHALMDAADAGPLAQAGGRVAFEGVRFAYPGREPILNGLDLTIEAGQRVGLVGASGAGKSTVIALLQRFYDVDGGAIRIDGQDLRAITQASLRSEIAVVPQDISLFHRSVRENIRYARPEASEADVLAAAEAARCRDFIEALPQGFDTVVGDRGTKLSGGQRQRLAIARALLKDAPILLLDEATSALDSESEQAIQAALDVLMRGRTVIAIAHRLSTLKSFDRIVVMDAGRVVDDGPPAVLTERPGPYRELLRRQGLLENAAA